MAYAKAIEALGDPTRRRIFELLGRGPRAVGDLATGLPVTRQAVSQHLRVLKAAGLVSERREGTSRIYRVEPAAVAELREYVDSLWSDALDAFAAATRKDGDDDGAD